MALRATKNQLRGIIKTSLGDEELVPFITTANIMVNELLLSEGYSDDLLKQIELWLAAHFLAVRDPRTSSDTIPGGPTLHYHGQTGIEGLKQTPYGTQVMMLDHHGILAKAAQSSGKVDFEALPYD